MRDFCLIIVALLAFAGIEVRAASADSTAQAAGQDSIFREVDLGGVTVEGRMAIQKDDHTNYMPTKRQVDASASGISLLARMMIPKLLVDHIGKTVKNADGTAPTIYIDNRMADATEADRLRPKDIVRVEYYDRPSPDFPGSQTVLNFITRKYDRGGYVDLRTSAYAYPWPDYGDCSLQASFDVNKFNVTLYAGSDFSREDTPGTTGTEYVGLANPFTKQATALGMETKTRNHYGLLRTKYRTEKTTAMLDLGFSWSEMPTNHERTLVSYSPQAYPASDAVTDTRSRNATPSARFFLATEVAKGHKLRVEANGWYGDNTYSRTYTEGALPAVVTDSKEKQYWAEAMLNYNADLKHDNSIGAMLYGNFSSNRTTYTGTMAADQRIDDGVVLFEPGYSHTFAKRLMLYLRMGLYWDIYRVKGIGTVSKLLPRPGATINYKINERNSVYAYWYMASNVPQMANYNNTEQRVNQYTVQRGNPHLDITKVHFVNASYNLSLKNANISVYGSSTIYTDYTKPYYMDEGGTLVSTYITDGKYVSYVAGVSASLFFFKRSLQLTPTLQYSGQRITGLNSTDSGRPLFALTGNYYIKNFSIMAQYVTKRRSIMWGSYIHEMPQFYMVELSWHHKGLHVAVGSQLFFEDSYAMRTWADHGVYRFDNSTTTSLNGRKAYVSLSYSFDFGRKKVEREKMEVQKGSSGIMRL